MDFFEAREPLLLTLLREPPDEEMEEAHELGDLVERATLSSEYEW